ncbi:hypothetical protein BB558_003589 [Smittium angustum]|uniref:HSF-type DNA-binding domain-containing protein n=1 Tax=Smittium angustum TaxID=133377 RepID=A0A2U1J5K1_SMIAN|nr:hypothetical protein BB558_003589 [Smittium angustum]
MNENSQTNSNFSEESYYNFNLNKEIGFEVLQKNEYISQVPTSNNSVFIEKNVPLCNNQLGVYDGWNALDQQTLKVPSFNNNCFSPLNFCQDFISSTSSNNSNMGCSTNTAAFVSKLYLIVENQKTSKLVSWSLKGNSFIVHNASLFSKEILPKYFKHCNFSSFVRQLNMYGFYKVNKTPRPQNISTGVNKPFAKSYKSEKWEFSHPKFIRGIPELASQIKRKSNDIDGKSKNLNPYSENVYIYTKIKEIEEKLNNLDSKCISISKAVTKINQNQICLEEISSQYSKDILAPKYNEQTFEKISNLNSKTIPTVVTQNNNSVTFRRNSDYHPNKASTIDGLELTRQKKNSWSGGQTFQTFPESQNQLFSNLSLTTQGNYLHLEKVDNNRSPNNYTELKNPFMGSLNTCNTIPNNQNSFSWQNNTHTNEINQNSQRYTQNYIDSPLLGSVLNLSTDPINKFQNQYGNINFYENNIEQKRYQRSISNSSLQMQNENINFIELITPTNFNSETFNSKEFGI